MVGVHQSVLECVGVGLYGMLLFLQSFSFELNVFKTVCCGPQSDKIRSMDVLSIFKQIPLKIKEFFRTVVS